MRMKVRMPCFFIFVLTIMIVLIGCTSSSSALPQEAISIPLIKKIPFNPSKTDSYLIEQLSNGSLIFCNGDCLFISFDGYSQLLCEDVDNVNYNEGILCVEQNKTKNFFSLCGLQLNPDDFISNPSSFVLNVDADTALFLQKGNNGLLGYVNRQGYWVIEPKYKNFDHIPYYQVEQFSNHYATILDSDNRPGIIDEKGNFQPLCINNAFTDDSNFYEGIKRFVIYERTTDLAILEKRIAFVNTNNERIQVIPPLIDAHNFSDEVAAVQTRTGWGYIDKAGKFLFDSRFQSAGDFFDGTATAVTFDNELIVINKSGDSTTPPMGGFSIAGEYHDGLFAAKEIGSNEWSLYNLSGTKILDNTYGSYQWINGLWVLRENINKYSVYLPTCNKIIKSDDQIRIFDSVIIIKNREKDALLDTASGNIIFKTDSIGDFNEGLAVAKKDGKFGYIDARGTWIFQPIYEQCCSFKYGLAYVEYGGNCYYIPNPLIYDSWTLDEKIRMVQFGLEYSNASTPIKYYELWNIFEPALEKLRDIFYRTNNEFQLELTVDSLKTELAIMGYQESDIVDRQHLSCLLKMIADSAGQNTSCYYSFYNDSDTILSSCYDAVAYVSTLNLFICENGIFSPEKAVTKAEISSLLLHFFESVI